MLPTPAQSILGTWISDYQRTLWELRRNFGPKHFKVLDYASHDFPLILHYDGQVTHYYYRDMTCKAACRIVAHDEESVMIEVQPSELNQQKLYHIHFLSPTLYWVAVLLDWGFVYREFFTRMTDNPDHAARILYANTPYRPDSDDKTESSNLGIS
jgi:hypothetical protein